MCLDPTDADASIRDPPSIETEHSVISSGYVYTSESETEERPATPPQTVNNSTAFGAPTRHGHTNASDDMEPFSESGLFEETWQSVDNLDGWEGFTSFITGDADVEGLETLTTLFPSDWPLY